MLYIDGKFWVSADYPHIRIPKRMLSDPQYGLLSPDAKMLYGAMMNRTSLSHKNQDTFTNENKEVFIYFAQSEIMQLLGCGHDKASKVLRELVDANLVRVKRRGVGRPYEIVLQPVDWRMRQKKEKEQSEKPLRNSDKSDYALCGKVEDNNTEYSYYKTNDIEDCIQSRFRDEIEYDDLIRKYDSAVIDRIIEVVMNTFRQETKSFLIRGEPVPAEWVKERLWKLKKENILYALRKIKNATYTTDHSDIFILNALYESFSNSL